MAGVGVCHALAPLADSVAAARANNWWSTPMDLAEQRCVCWLDMKDLTAPVTRTTEKLAAWRVSTVADEHAARERQPNPATKWTGRWWSAPCLADLASTTRPPPGSETWGPALTEDGLGLTEACCWPVMTTRTPRVYEISDATAWVELVASYPLQVTLSRRHDWWRVTGLTGDWLIPDYAAVAAEYDAVHLSVYGYLTRRRSSPRRGPRPYHDRRMGPRSDVLVDQLAQTLWASSGMDQRHIHVDGMGCDTAQLQVLKPQNTVDR